MKCAICKNGETYPGTTTVTLTRGEATIVIKNVPAEVCDNCGESVSYTHLTLPTTPYV